MNHSDNIFGAVVASCIATAVAGTADEAVTVMVDDSNQARTTGARLVQNVFHVINVIV